MNMKELVFVNNNNEVVTDSLMVADHFNKNHKDVLKAIRNIVDTLNGAGIVGERNFAPCTYEAENGRNYKKVVMTRDGFSMLVMGFTGKEALVFRANFINEFNRMEDYIRSQEKPKTALDQIQQLLLEGTVELKERVEVIEDSVEKLQNTMTIDYGQQLAIENAKKQRVEKLWDELEGKTVHDTKRKLYAHFGKELKRVFAVGSYRDIAAKDFEEAMNFTKGWRPQLV
ncbi:TPA: Rha family transcriptional regulator [Bacillus paranthracis]|nr:Rha family transcriptional regulator [Bacillus paranthracis]